MSKRYGRVLAAMVAGLTAPQHPWRRASTRLRVANALFQTHEIATRHGPLRFITSHPGELYQPRDLAGREPETICSSLLAEAFGRVRFPILPLPARKPARTAGERVRQQILGRPTRRAYSGLLRARHPTGAVRPRGVSTTIERSILTRPSITASSHTVSQSARPPWRPCRELLAQANAAQKASPTTRNTYP